MRILPAVILSLAMLVVRGQDILVSVDLNRNLPGSSADKIIGIAGETNDIYFAVSGVAARFSNYTLEDTSSGLLQPDDCEASLLTIFTTSEVIVRITFNPLHAGLISSPLKIKVNETGAFDLTFTLEEMQDATLISCLNDIVTIKAPLSRNQTYVAVWGSEGAPECNFQILLDGSLKVDIPMSACNIQWEQEFFLRFTRMTEFEGLPDDLNARLTCKRITNQFVVSNKDVLSRYNIVLDDDDLSYEHEVQVTMYLHERDDPSAVITNQGILVKSEVSLAIEVDALYRNDFDLVPLSCSANNITILGSPTSLATFQPDKAPEEMPDVACAVGPFENFGRVSPGHFRSDFLMFRTILNGVSSSYVNFECLMFVCRAGECPTLNCIQDIP